MSELGRLPDEGESVVIATGTFRIERLDGRRIDRVRYTPLSMNDGGADTALDARGSDHGVASRG